MTYYKHGTHNANCAVCGFDYKADELKLRWDGLYVCEQDWEPRHILDFFRGPKPEKQIDWAQRNPEDTTSTLTGRNYLSLNGVPGNHASTPGRAANAVTGDLDIRVLAALDDWTPTFNQGFVNKNFPSTNSRNFRFAIETSGDLFFQGSTDGTLGNLFFGQSTASPTISDGEPLWVRVTLDVDDGAGNRVITFYTSTDTTLEVDDVTWTQLGTAITTAGTVSVFNDSTDYEIGGNHSGGEIPADGKIYYAEVLSGINGTSKVKFDAREFPLFAKGGAGSDNNFWNFCGSSRIEDA